MQLTPYNVQKSKIKNNSISFAGLKQSGRFSIANEQNQEYSIPAFYNVSQVNSKSGFSVGYRIIKGKQVICFQGENSNQYRQFSSIDDVKAQVNEYKKLWIKKHIQSADIPVFKIKNVLKNISTNPRVARIQFIALNNLENADNIYNYESIYVQDIVKVIKNNPEIAKIQLQVQEKLLRGKTIKHIQLIEKIVGAISEDKEVALKQLSLVDASISNLSFITEVFKNLKKEDAPDVVNYKLDWAKKSIKGDFVIPAKMIGYVLHKSSSSLNIAKIQLEWVSKMINKYPQLTSSLFLGHLIGALAESEDEETVNKKFAFAEVVLDKLFNKKSASLIDDYKEHYGFGIIGVFERLSRYKDVFNYERDWILEKLNTNEYSVSDISDIIACIPDYKNFSLEDYKELMYIAEDIPKIMIERRNILKSGLFDLTDNDIKSFVCLHANEIKLAQKILGKSGFIDSFGLKLDGLEVFLEMLDNIETNVDKKTFEQLLQIFNPEESQKGKNIKKLIDELKAENQVLAKIEDLSIKKTPMDIRNMKIAKLKKELFNMHSVLGNMPTKSKIAKLKVISGIANGGLPYEISDLLKIINNEEVWDEAVNKMVFCKYGIPYDKSNPIISFEETEYLSNLLSNKNPAFEQKFKELINYLIRENAFKNNNVSEVLDRLPQNIQTKKDFDQLGINYDRWIRPDNNSYEEINVNLSADKSRKSVLESLEQDFNDDSFKLIPNKQKNEILSALKQKGIILKEADDSYINTLSIQRNNVGLNFYYDGKRLPFSKIETIISTVTSIINKGEFWNLENQDKTVENAKRTFIGHVTKLRKNEYNLAKKSCINKVTNLRIKQVDMASISHSLFLGNHSACCTAIGSFNDAYAPAYIKNRLVSAIEVVDGMRSVGNSMCYIAKVDGVPSLILDNIELSSRYQYNDKIRDAFFRYAKRFVTELGKPDMPIYAGPYRHKLNISEDTKKTHNVQIVGSTFNDEIYIDGLNQGCVVDGRYNFMIDLYKIK